MGFFGVRVGFKNCFGVSLYRLISFVISVWLYKSYIGSELKSKVSRWTARRPNGDVKIMPLVAPTPQLRLRWTKLSWSVGAECGNTRTENLRIGTIKIIQDPTTMIKQISIGHIRRI